MKILFYTIIFFFTIPCWSHVDTKLKYEQEKIIGLPPKYEPAILSLKSKTLQIGKKKVDLYELFSNSLPEKLSDLKVSIVASWYHDLSKLGSGLPPYMLVSIEQSSSNHWINILFDLETAEPIESKLIITNEKKGTHQSFELKQYKVRKLEGSDLSQQEVEDIYSEKVPPEKSPKIFKFGKSYEETFNDLEKFLSPNQQLKILLHEDVKK